MTKKFVQILDIDTIQIPCDIDKELNFSNTLLDHISHDNLYGILVFALLFLFFLFHQW